MVIDETPVGTHDGDVGPDRVGFAAAGANHLPPVANCVVIGIDFRECEDETVRGEGVMCRRDSASDAVTSSELGNRVPVDPLGGLRLLDGQVPLGRIAFVPAVT